MEQLKRHIQRLIPDFFSTCKASSRWETKLLKICDRAIGTYSRTEKPCSFFDPNLPNGGPANKKRRRRYVEDDNMRYSETDALASINGITSGIKKWSKRYLAECNGQKKRKSFCEALPKVASKIDEKI